MGNKHAKFKDDLNDLATDESLVQALKGVPLLSKYSDDELAKLGALVGQKTFAPGDVIIRQGDAAEGFYIIRSGQVAVEIEREESKVEEVARLTGNDYFGECALLQKNSTRNSTIRCLEPTQTFYLSTADFKKIFSEAALNVQFVKRKVAVTAGAHETQTYERPADVSIDKSPETAARIYDVVKDNLLFKHFAPEIATAIIAEMHHQDCGDGEEVISQGDKGDFFYVIEKGQFDIIVGGNKVAEFGVGKAFGELALMYNSPRKATVRATSGPCSVWAIHRVLFRTIVKDHSQGALAQYTSFLKEVPLLQGLANYERNKIADALEVVDIAAGETLFEQGEEGSAMYILKQGDVEITKDGEVLTSYSTPGAFFGERSLMTKEPRAGKATAKAATTLLVIDKQTFDSLLGPLNDLLSKAVSSYNSSGGAREEKSADGARDSVLDDWEPVPFEGLKTLGTLGKGSFGHVTLVQVEGDDSRTFALKAIKKAMIVETSQQGHVMSEKRVMEQLRHPFLIRLFQTYKDRDNLYFLLEPVMGGELFTVLRKMHLFIDKTARFYAACVVLAFEYMHSLDIIYRDLKPENLLVDEMGYIKVTDFGFAKHIDQRTWTLCGTPDYLAPEIVGGKGHGKGVDWWTLGILIYEMLDGQPPFYDEDAMNTYNMIITGELKFKQHFTAQARSLIKKLLYKKASRRLGVIKGGASFIKKHVWFQSYNKQFAETLLTGWDELYNKNVKAPHIPKINSSTDMSNFDFEEDEDDGYAGHYVDDGSGWDADF